MASTVATLLVTLTLASIARAAEVRSASVVCRGPLPFGHKDLLEAINIRIPLMKIDLQQSMPVVEVRAIPPDRASIKVGAARRVVSLRGLSSADAARIVALLTLDLVSNQQKEAVPEQPPVEPAPPVSDFVFVGLSPRLAIGVSQWSPSFEPTIDLGVKVWRQLVVFFELGFTWTGAGSGDARLTLYEIPIRAGAAFRYAWFEARAGVVLRPYFVSGAGADQGVLAGGALGLYFRRALTPWLVGYAAAGVDLFPLRKEFQVGGETALSTSWAVPWLGIGAGWQGG